MEFDTRTRPMFFLAGQIVVDKKLGPYKKTVETSM